MTLSTILVRWPILMLLASTVLVPLVVSAAEQDFPEGAGRAELLKSCGVCHNTDTDEKKIGPSLKGLYKHDKLKNGKKVTDETVKAIINAGGNGMPAYADLLSEPEKTNVIAYLRTL